MVSFFHRSSANAGEVDGFNKPGKIPLLFFRAYSKRCLKNATFPVKTSEIFDLPTPQTFVLSLSCLFALKIFPSAHFSLLISTLHVVVLTFKKVN